MNYQNEANESLGIYSLIAEPSFELPLANHR